MDDIFPIDGFDLIDEDSRSEDDSAEESQQQRGDEENALKMEEQIPHMLKTSYNNRISMTTVADATTIKLPCIIMTHRYSTFGAKTSKWIDTLYQVALKFEKDQLYFLVKELVNDEYGPATKYQLMNADYPPEVKAVDVLGRTYDFINFHKVDLLYEFCEKLVANKLYKSDELPTALEPGKPSVIVAVADNFEALVLQSSQDIFLTLYATWCCFSRELLPKLDQLADMLTQAEDEVMVVKMNAETNYLVPQFRIKAYPKTFFIPGRKASSPIARDYHGHRIPASEYCGGPRTMENLIKFIAANSTKELRDYDRQGVFKPK